MRKPSFSPDAEFDCTPVWLWVVVFAALFGSALLGWL